MFFKSSKLDYLHSFKKNQVRILRHVRLLVIILSLLNLLQDVSSQAIQLESQRIEGLSAEHAPTKPISNEQEKLNENGKAQQLFFLYKALFETDSDRLTPRHRRTLHEHIDINGPPLISSDTKGHEVSPTEPHEVELGAQSVRSFEQTVPSQSEDERGLLIPVSKESGPSEISESSPASFDSSTVTLDSTGNLVGSNLSTFIPVLPANNIGFQKEYQPSLAELTAAGTAAGLMVSDLATLADSSEDSPGFEEDLAESPDNGGEELYKGLDKVIAKSSLPIRAQEAPEQPTQEASDDDQHPAQESPDSMPENIESLMGVDGAVDSDESADDQQPPQQLQPQDTLATNQIQNESGDPLLIKNSAINAKQNNNDDDYGENDNDNDNYDEEEDDDDKKKRVQSNLIPASLPSMTPQGVLLDGDNQLALMHNSPDELKTAAGHYKKKKVKKVKKVVIKKKVKKKKVKKVKKVKIVKYKKKKKKKPKKKHHHHHDHGKYYMYAKVPKKKAWEFGFKKGNKKHWISRHEKGYKNKFKTKVKWYDKKSKGKGVHIWDYNHHDKKKKYG